MKRLFAVALTALLASLSAHTQDKVKYATPAEAEALVKKAVVYYQKNGKDKALAEFSKSPGLFIDRDLYVTVYDLQGDCLAHVNPKMIGRNMMDLRDADGRHPIKERVEEAATKTSGWQELTFFNPQTKKVEPKQMYWEKHDSLIFAAGAYKPR